MKWINEFSQVIIWVAACALILTVIVQQQLVDWRTDKCGCLAVWLVGSASAWVLYDLAEGMVVNPSMAGVICAVTVFFLCRLGSRRYPNGPYGRSAPASLFAESFFNQEKRD